MDKKPIEILNERLATGEISVEEHSELKKALESPQIEESDPPSNLDNAPPDKTKKTAVTLSCFFGPFAWLYTLKRDWWKALASVILAIPWHIGIREEFRLHEEFRDSTDLEAFLIIVPIILLPFYLWPIILNSLRSPNIFSSIPE